MAVTYHVISVCSFIRGVFLRSNELLSNRINERRNVMNSFGRGGTLDPRSVLGVVAAIGGLLQFGVGLQKAVITFPGKYSFSRHFLSDLGRSDKPSAVHFNIALIVLGVCLIVFFLNSFRELESEGRTFRLAGVLSSVGLIGIGLTPLDRMFVWHHVFLVLWILPMIAMIFSIMSITMRVHGRSALTSVVVGVILLCMTGLYISAARTAAAPLVQKLVVIGACVWLCLICSLSVQSAVRQIARIRFGHDRATQSYIRKLERDGLGWAPDSPPRLDRRYQSKSAAHNED